VQNRNYTAAYFKEAWAVSVILSGAESKDLIYQRKRFFDSAQNDSGG